MFESLNFPVALMEIENPGRRGEMIKDRRAIVRTDTGDILNIVSAKYPLVPHVEVFGPMQEAITALNLPVTKVVERSAHNGGYARVEWVLEKSFKVADPKINDTMNITITARNSYNYSSVVGLEFGTRRLICLNGMTVGSVISGTQKRHVPNLNVAELIKQIVGIVEKTDAVQNLMSAWSSIDYSRERFAEWLDKQAVAKPARQEILDYYAVQPDRVAAGGLPALTGWEAANAITWYSTHRATARRQDLAVLAQERIEGLAHKFTREELASRN